MRATQNAVINQAAKEKTQFQITSDLLRNLYKFNLTPATKLVLLELTTHLNESKNGSVVFPSVGYISEVLGIGLTAAKKAINDLIKEGLIIKSKRNKVRGNCNKYLLTLKVQNMTPERSENEHLKRTKCDLFMITNNNEQKTEQTVIKKQSVKNTSIEIKGGNVYSDEDEILVDYAVKHKAKSVNAYIAKLKETGSAAKIIKEYNKKRFIKLRSINEQIKQRALFAQWRKDAENAVHYSECSAWVELGKKINQL